MPKQQNLSQFNRYLSNNRDLLVDKHNQQFNTSPPPTLQNLPVDGMVTYIYDIFSFDRYQSDLKMNQKIITSLQKNILDFVQNNPTRWNEPFTTDTTIEVLMYCIEHNDMFNVQYEPEKKEEEQGGNHSNENILNVEVIRKSEIKEENHPDNPEKGEGKQRQKANYGAKGPETNEFDQNPEPFHYDSNSDLVKKNAKLAFLSYCKNQMELGGKRTFDILSEQARTMTIGKLLVYSKAYNILSSKITKELLMKRFKKISEGKRSIDFQKFYILISEMKELQPDLFERLQFHDENLYKKIKFVKYPFYTQDQNPREVVSFRAFSNKLTEHSGKTQDDLKQDLISKKNSQNLGRLRSMHRYNRDQPNIGHKQKLLSPRDLSGKTRDYSIDLSFIDKIVAPEDNDHKYLGQYEINHLSRKAQDLLAVNSSAILRRKDSILDNIRKRIIQIQRNQTSVHRPRPYLRRNPF